MANISRVFLNNFLVEARGGSYTNVLVAFGDRSDRFIMINYQFFLSTIGRGSHES